MSSLLSIKNLKVNVGEKEILHGIDLTIGKGETHVIMGPNGAGKSTLGNAVMGNPNYEITEGSIEFEGKDIHEENATNRAKMGIYLSFQNPIEVPGISLSNFMRNSLENVTGSKVKIWDFRKKLEEKSKALNMDKEYADRDLNVGFSGGEKKKSEILQLLMLNPKLAILDETDSGLDVDAVKTVSEGIKEFQKDKERSLIIITHSTRILEALDVDYTHVIVDGKLVETGDASLVDKINKNGFESYTA
ncbi:MAG: Fe-S cluster assembly ATPase SufC [Lachnospiraceae bacterium]|nr:Fe-S cluster assembly ATPase SufC [Lachnospiraceae bacterium]MBO7600210.1 Fe-S cluster assembly ATPase SufC [Lachnospiraceae bacterium]